MKKPSVLIVGAGPGGLAASIGMADAFDVTVMEKNPWPGGRMGRIVEQGYAFDTGPSILQYPQALRDVFAMANANVEDYIKLLPVEPYTYIKFWDDSELYSWTDLEKMMSSVEQLEPGLGERFKRWAIEHEAKYKVAYDAFIASPADSIMSYFNPLKTAPAARFKPWQSLYDCLMDYFDDERLTYALSYPAKYLGLHPTTCSSVFSVIAYLEYAFGVWYPEGGFRAMADAMMRCAQDHGATFEMNTAVEQILTDGGRAIGVRTSDGQVHYADYVVCNADFAYANQALIHPSARKKYTDDKLHRMKYSCSTFMLYLGLDKLYDLPHHAIYLSDHTRATDAVSLEDAALDLEDPPFYVCNPSVTDPNNAPDGHSTLYVLVPCPNDFHAVDWSTQAQHMRDATIKRLALLGYEDIDNHIQYERVYTTETWRDDYNVFKGAVFNLSHNWTQIGPMRPHCKSEDVENLYFVGGGTHPGSGLLTIFESARIATASLKDAQQPTGLKNKALQKLKTKLSLR